MRNTTSWTATRKARALTPAHRGTALACAPVAGNGIGMSPFAPTYVVDQESHPPRERAVG